MIKAEMDEKVIQTLEFDRIRERLAGLTSFSVGRERASELRPSPDYDEVVRRQRLTAEARRLAEIQPSAAVVGAHDIRPLVDKAALAGVLDPGNLLDIESTLSGARKLKGTLGRLAGEVPMLAGLSRQLADLPHAVDGIKSSIDQRGEVLDSASPALGRIRKDARVAHDRLVQKMNSLIQSPEGREVTQEPLVTQRDGRYVIPVKADLKGRLPGIVHDVSSSGATLWVEPLAVVDLGNRWRELQAEEQHEIERVLRRLSGLVGEHAESIQTTVEALADIDLCLACARLGDALAARELPVNGPDQPWLVEAPAELRLQQARHPLLKGEVVPVTVSVGGEDKAVLITGPNTGGKTVALKTAGLLTLMAQAGLPVPADDGSRVPIFDRVFADIGDEQSIEQSLSTFSSHMRNIIAILDEVTPRSLVLLDELAAGTDPVEGAALAQAIIERLLDSGCSLIATTHHGELKVFAHNTPGVTNASVEFDTDTLAPTYHLKIGLPGRSNALAIARRLGMTDEVLSRAGEVVEPDRAEFEKLLSDIQRERDEAQTARRAEEHARREAEQVRSRLESRLDEIDEQREQMAEAALRDLEREVGVAQEALQKAQRTLGEAEMRSVEAARAQLQAAEERAESLRRKATPRPRRGVQPVAPVDRSAIAVGDLVYLDGLERPGEVLSVGDATSELDVLLGSLRTTVKSSQVVRVEKPALRRDGGVTVQMRPAPTGVSSEVHLRGERVEAALPLLEAYLDDAFRAGYPSVRVVHGKGTGTMRQVVRNLLSGHPLVRSFETAAPNEGGEGVTVAHLAR
jgi:DNA mismatch repair protein MutS2